MQDELKKASRLCPYQRSELVRTHVLYKLAHFLNQKVQKLTQMADTLRFPPLPPHFFQNPLTNFEFSGQLVLPLKHAVEKRTVNTNARSCEG